MRSLIFASLLILPAAGIAYAGDDADDVPGPDWITKTDLIKKMEGQGYSSIKAEADDGQWEGTAEKDGQPVKFHADPRSGDLTMTRPKTKE